MDEKCRKICAVRVPCLPVQVLPTFVEPAPAGHVPEAAGRRGIAFSVEPLAGMPHEVSIPIPGYDAPAIPFKTVRDPSLSLIALSGIDPSGPVMVEVPLVQNNTTFTATPALAGRRVGVAERFDDQTPIEHHASFLRALEILRRAGAHLVLVPARAAKGDLHFTLQSLNEVDELVSEYRLDAVVSDSRTGAFHSACWNGYPALNEPLEDGATLWFYGARWSKAMLAALVQGYRSVRALTPV
ncbi:hypothetical protein [Pseudomonas sp. AF03-9]|uniref:hypothetical protein n=1 Tax=Pseudomonas sp. AF03-9 TaxID=2849867 RepID=UPI001CFBADE1|nr:hypothetical protein [Pseudomonas sp. AF03-9]